MPANFEYKPLGFEAFAKPLEQMQGYYDATRGAIEDLDFQIQALPWGTDKEKAKELAQGMVAKRDELTKSLIKSKDYRTSARSLKGIQKDWSKDKHRKALESNYAQWTALDKEQKERIGKPGGLSQNQYEEWKARSVADFDKAGGTNFKADDFDGTWSKIGRQVRLADKTKEIRELSVKIGGMTKGQKRDFISRNKTKYGDIENLTTIIDENNPDVIEKKVEDFLRTQPDFVEWANEMGDYKHWEISQNPERYNKVAESLIDNRITTLDNLIENHKKLAKKKKDKSLLENENYLNAKDDRDNLAAMKESKEYNPDTVRNLVHQQTQADLFDADAVGNVFGYKNVTHRRSYTKDPNARAAKTDEQILADMQKRWTPDQEQPNIVNMHKKINTAKGAMYGNIKAAYNLSKGGIRSIALPVNREEREKLSKDPIAMQERSKIIYSTINEVIKNKRQGEKINIKDIAFVENALKLHGEKNNIDFNIKRKTIMQVLSDANTKDSDGNSIMMNNFANAVKENEIYSKAAGYTQDHLNMLNEAVEDSPEWKKFTNAYGSIEKLKLLRENFDPTDNTTVALTKLGLDKSLGANVSQMLSALGNNPMGVKAYLDRKIAEGRELKQGLVDGMTDRQMMSHLYVGDDALNKTLALEFTDPTKVTSFRLAGDQDWSSLPGFDKHGKMEEGTFTNPSEDNPVLLKRFGSEIFLRVPYEYGEGKDKLPGHIDVEFKSGTKPFQQAILQYLRNTSIGQHGALGEQNRDMVNSTMFDILYESSSVPYLADDTPFRKNDNGELLETTIDDLYLPQANGNTVNLEIVKVPEDNTSNIPGFHYEIRLDGQALANDGKLLNKTNADRYRAKDLLAAKSFIIEELNP